MRTRMFGAILADVIGVILVQPYGANAAAVAGQGTWESTLQGRDLDGVISTFEAYYDTQLNITWLADANYAYTSGAHFNGAMFWSDANAWAAGLNFNGVNGWRLPRTTPVNGIAFNSNVSYDGSTDVGYNISKQGSAYPSSGASEMAHMFYTTLGNSGICEVNGICGQSNAGVANSGPFSNIQSYYYWTSTEHASPEYAWHFLFAYGSQDARKKLGEPGVYAGLHAWAVHPGDVGAPVPLPAAVWLLGSGLIGLFGAAACRRRNP